MRSENINATCKHIDSVFSILAHTELVTSYHVPGVSREVFPYLILRSAASTIGMQACDVADVVLPVGNPPCPLSISNNMVLK